MVDEEADAATSPPPSAAPRSEDSQHEDEDGSLTVFNTDFLDDDFGRRGTSSSTATFAGSMAPFRPDNWEEMLEEAAAAYPPRAGPRRNKEAERQRNRQWVIRKQHKVTKRQLKDSRADKQVVPAVTTTARSTLCPRAHAQIAYNCPISLSCRRRS